MFKEKGREFLAPSNCLAWLKTGFVCFILLQCSHYDTSLSSVCCMRGNVLGFVWMTRNPSSASLSPAARIKDQWAVHMSRALLCNAASSSLELWRGQTFFFLISILCLNSDQQSAVSSKLEKKVILDDVVFQDEIYFLK